MSQVHQIVEAEVNPFQTIKGKTKQAWKLLIYGMPGVGKSTFATHAPKPIFLDLENGLRSVDCEKTPTRLTTLEQVVSWLRYIVTSPDYETVVIDTIDELERMLSEEVLLEYNRENKKCTTIADIPYGRGGELLVAKWRWLLEVLDKVQAHGNNVLLIGHEQIVKFENPTDANYDFYTVNIHKKAAPVVTAKLDGVFFARFETAVKNAKDGKGKAVATGGRILQTTQGSSWIAKNRFGFDGTVPMEPSIFERII